MLHTPTRGTRSSPTWDPRRHCGLLPSSNLGKMLDCASRLTPHSVLKVLEINLDRLKVNYGVSRGGHKWCSSGARAPLCGESASLAWTFRLAWETRHVEVGMWVARRRDVAAAFHSNVSLRSIPALLRRDQAQAGRVKYQSCM